MNLIQQQTRLREALRAVLYLRAKIRGQTGAVPTAIDRRVSELTTALTDCSLAVQRQTTEHMVAQADAHATAALADAEVEMMLA